MAARFRIPPRAQVPRQLSCPHIQHPRPFTLSARLQASKPAASSSQSQTIRLRSQHAPKPQKATRSPPPPPPRPSPPPSNPNSIPQSVDTVFQQRKWPLVGAGFLALGMGFYISLVITSSLRQDKDSDKPNPNPNPNPSPSTIPSLTPNPCTCPPTGLPSTLDTTSPTTAHLSALSFDAGLNLPERLTGITSLRKALAARARGHVLEVAVGTGRNLAYYDWTEVVAASEPSTPETDAARAQRERERMAKLLQRHQASGVTVREQKAQEGMGTVGSLEGEVLSFTGVDVSGEMVGVARDRVREAVPGLKRAMRKRRAEAMPRLGGEDGNGEEEIVVVDALDGRVRLVLEDAVRGLPAPPPESSKYDTIIQTFGLCSVADPARLLANMAGKLQPDTGRIILLEHGRGWYGWTNNLLDEYAPRHFEKYGCWWNRDIEQLVREAAQAVPGLEVVALERPGRFQFGTTLLVELRVKSQQAGAGSKKA